jgi:molybdenum cofactor cytidylyltransferase
MHDSPSEPRIWGIIPAAGLSRRFGRPKQLLPLEGSTIVGTVVRTILDANVNGVIVVTRTLLAADLRLPLDSRVRVAINDDDRSEMIDSIRIGLGVIDQFQPDDQDGVLVLPGDMPAVNRKICGLCLAAYRRDPRRIVIATYGHRRGHPIIFPYYMQQAVRDLTEGLNALPCIYPAYVSYVEVDDPGVNLDIDTPEDWGRNGQATSGA